MLPIKLGFIDEKEMETFEKDSSNLMGHPIKNLNYGIEFSWKSWNGFIDS